MRKEQMRTPFQHLVLHFIKRMFSSDQENGTESMSFGIGAVIALLASPGVLACFLLLVKYADASILLLGHRFDAYKFSAPDEYFFIILSLTIIGMIMVLRWNRLLPDRRDFANLAALPISARDVFLANLIALLALALLFAVVVNGISWFLYPAVVTFADGTLLGFLRVAVSHFAAVFSASLFAFFAVFALVGLLMLLLPKRLFPSVSVGVRVVLVVALLSELPSTPNGHLGWLPPVWFLGVYENVAGFASPGMTHLGARALWFLLAAILVSLAAYSLCYRRHYLRLAESLDLVGSATHRFHPPLPVGLERILFRSRFERACLSFIVKTVVRSERHVLFFGAYLGVGLVLVRSVNVFAIPMLIAFFLITGLRFSFDIPAVLNANWVFRSSVERPYPPLRSIALKLALALTLPWQLLLVTPLTAHLFGWRIALAHTATVAVLTILAAELLFAKFRAIPFTCSVQSDIQRFLARILGTLFALLIAVPMLAGIEQWMLRHPTRFIPAVVLVLLAWPFLRVYKRDILDMEQPLTFEERAPSSFELLKLA